MAEFDMVFEGGGAKGAVFVGALQVLDAQGHTGRRFIGTSAGAITATLLAAGYTPKEMYGVVREKLADGKPRFTSFMDPPAKTDFTQADLDDSVTQETLDKVDLPLVPSSIEKRIDRILLGSLMSNERYRQLFSFVERGGFYQGKAFLDWLDEKLAAKGVAKGATLAQFAAGPRKPDLSLVASDTTAQEMLVLNHRTAPEVPVAWAVRMSMSIPFVWQEVIWKKEWGTYRATNKSGNTIVDGGVLSNFPIRLVADPDADDRLMMGNEDPGGAESLGMLIDERIDVHGEPAALPSKNKIANLRTVQRISRLIDTMTGASDNEMIRFYASSICHLPAKGYGTLEFDLDGDRLMNFLKAGQAAMIEHLKGRGLYDPAKAPPIT